MNYCRTVEEQNIQAVQYENSIYYMATRVIYPKEELLTYSGENFGKLGLQIQTKEKERKFYILVDSVPNITTAFPFNI